jgi:F0F1-type ATP synthase assembly protein I
MGIVFLRVLGPIKTTLGVYAAVQAGFWGWGNGFNRVFRVATGKSMVFGELTKVVIRLILIQVVFVLLFKCHIY